MMPSAYATQRTDGLRRIAVRFDVFFVQLAVAVAFGWMACAAAYKVDQLGWLRWRSDELSQVAVAVNAPPRASSPAIVRKTKEVAAQAKAAAYLGCPQPLP